MAESREGVCKHGGLRRQCETCDLAEEVAALAAERDRLAKVAEAAKELERETPELWGDLVEDGIVRHYYKEDTLHALFAALSATGEKEA